MENPLKNAKKTVFATVTDSEAATIIIGIGDLSDEQIAEQRAEVQKALRAGATVTWPDGREQWETVEVVWIPSGKGSEQFVWDKSGDKAKHERFLNTSVDGEISIERIGTLWRKF